jgi:hypothetical protein
MSLRRKVRPLQCLTSVCKGVVYRDVSSCIYIRASTGAEETGGGGGSGNKRGHLEGWQGTDWISLAQVAVTWRTHPRKQGDEHKPASVRSEPVGPIKCGRILDRLTNCSLLTKDCAPLS